MKRLVSLLSVLVLAVGLVAVTSAPAQADKAFVKKAQQRLNDLGCNAGPVDGELGLWTRSGVVRFQSRHGLKQTGRLTRTVRRRLYAEDAQRCDRRPVPARSGKGRRVVISQGQNWVWLVGPKGGVLHQAGMVDLPSELSKGRHHTGSFCGRAARIKRNTTSSGTVWLYNFVRFAPCGIGFHRIPVSRSSGAQIHPDWYLGTNFDSSHGCIRLSRATSLRLWRFTAGGAAVHVV